ncbi:MAG: META domain-containing protein [Tannerellaceae bacterium]|nr:META domain-containing protein [Tannerellaceae bacterium]
MKRIFFYVLMIAVVCGFMSACSNHKGDARKLDGRWNIKSVNGDQIVTERTPFLEFNIKEGKLHGNAGCNVVNSAIKLDDKDQSALIVERGVTTMMACPDLETEDRVLRALEHVSYVKDGSNSDEMYLTDNTGTVLLVLTKQ